MFMKERVTNLTVWLNNVFIIEQQWSSMAQNNKICQALDTQTVLVNFIHSLLVLVFSMTKNPLVLFGVDRQDLEHTTLILIMRHTYLCGI